MNQFFCPFCNGKVEANDLMVHCRCSYCGRDLYAVLQRYNRFIYQLPSGAVGELLYNAGIHLRGSSWDHAWACAQSAIDLDPTNPLCYLYLLMAETRSSYIVNLEDSEESFATFTSYRMFRKFAPRFLLAEVNMYLRNVIFRLEDDMDSADEEFIVEDRDAESIYRQAVILSSSGASIGDFSRAADLFGQIPDYRDAISQRKRCEKMASALRTDTHMKSILSASAAVLVFFLAYALFAGGLF